MAKKKPQTPKTARLPPRRQKNADLRTREYLSDKEIEALRKAARNNQYHGLRNDTIILLMFTHALRVSELTALRWEQIDFKKGILHVKRIKNGTPATHPLRGQSLRALRQLAREYPDSNHVFVSERKTPLSTRSIRNLIAETGKLANFKFPIHPHMLRHSTGFYLANKGIDTRAIQAYMGHANIKNTVIYTELNSSRFNNFWND